MLRELPIDSALARIVDTVRANSITIVQAPPGSGKTTRVAPALMRAFHSTGSQRIYLLQPRRLAARSVAQRIANENGWELGCEVGYQVRFERKFSRTTPLVVATEGVLVRKLQEDATLSDTAIVVLDEFHERSLDADLLLGMLRQVQATLRDDLRIVLMSATIDAELLGEALGQAPTIQVEGQMFPVSVRYRPPSFQQSIVDAMKGTIIEAAAAESGDILAFLPGQGEIHRVAEGLRHEKSLRDTVIETLYGSLTLEEQSRIIQPTQRRRVVLSTNIAETSLTIEGIRIVVDSGQARVMRFDPSVGLDRLVVEPISLDSATQRMGRAGRLCDGVCYRMWSESSHRSRSPSLEPEIRRVDLASTVLALLEWGELHPERFPWVTPPRAEAITAAQRLLEHLGATERGALTEIGKRMASLPLHPRLGRMVLEGQRYGALRPVALAAAMLSERDPFQPRASRQDRGTRSVSLPTAQVRRWDSDVAMRVELLERFRESGEPETIFGWLSRNSVHHLQQVAKDIERQVMELDIESGTRERPAEVKRTDTEDGASEKDGDWAIMRAVLAGFPDRVAKRRGFGRDSALMVGGKAVQLSPSSGVQAAELFVCVDIDAAKNTPNAVVRQASKVEESWLQGPLLQELDELFYHPTQQQVVARRRIYWDDLVLSETPVAIEDRSQAAEILYQTAIHQWSNVFPADDGEVGALIERTRWLRSVAPEVDLPDFSDETLRQVCRELCDQVRSIPELRKARWYDWLIGRFTAEQLQLLDREAPARMQVPSGSMIRMEYRQGASPILAVKIQEVFSWKSTPRVGMGRVPVLLHLLAPNMRPQQITDDLASFWATGYAVIKKELKRRYPKHAWPDDPSTATPSKR